MFIVSLILTLVSSTISGLLLKRALSISKNKYVIGKLVSVEIPCEDSVQLYEATYKYEINGKPRIYVSDKRKRRANSFDKEIKLYYKDNTYSVFEKPSEDILVISLVLTCICVIGLLIYTILL